MFLNLFSSIFQKLLDHFEACLYILILHMYEIVFILIHFHQIFTFFSFLNWCSNFKDKHLFLCVFKWAGKEMAIQRSELKSGFVRLSFQ